jgi:biotin carboxyl carrier protein
MRKFFKILISFGLLMLLIAPLIAIFMLSKEEVKQYEPQPVPPLIEKAYGEICPVKRMDLSETIIISGTFVSTKKFFMELPRLRKPYGARMLIESGAEIHEGQLIGYSENKKTEIRATASGIVHKIKLGTTAYITLESIDDVALDCRMNDTTLKVLERKGLKLTTQEGDEVKILSISKTQDDKGNTTVLLSMPNGIYGKRVKDLHLQTGRIFYQTLVVDSRCLFHLNGDKKTWYVRNVDVNGNYLEDIKVNVSYTSGDYTAISGVPEGTLCDSGYSKIAEESS